MSFTNYAETQPNLGEHIRVSYEELSRRRYARWGMTLSLIVSDLASLSLAFVAAVFLLSRLSESQNFQLLLERYWMPGLALFILSYALSGLYPMVGVSPVDELRLLVKATSTVFILFMAISIWLGDPLEFSPLVLGLAWPLALISTQLSRWLLRILARELGVWGEAVVMIGTGPQTEYVNTYIKDSLRLGIRPVASIDGYWIPDESFSRFLKGTGIRTAILIMPEMSQEMKDRIVGQRQYGFHRLILIPSLEWVYSLGVSTYDLEGLIGLEVRRNLLNRPERFLKRCIDLILVVIGGLLVSPVLLAIGVLIHFESPGKVLYKQERVGVEGRPFKVWKFRTMVPNADQVLQECLAANPDLKAEWETTQKLKNDPRVTRVGRILRKFSVDELPQILNVLIGEMSLVGPRPIVKAEIEHYRHVFGLYQLVRPGMTGLWQVSGRSDIGYDQRVRYDEYYIRNWSIWLDIYILLRTPLVVLSRRGSINRPELCLNNPPALR